MRKDRLTPSEVRRIALAAQGFATARPKADIGRRHLKRVLEHTGLLQIDSVNVVARAHTLPLFSRLGPYPAALLDRCATRKPRMLFEYWAHEASLLPVETQPFLRWRMANAEAGHGVYKHLALFGREKRDFIKNIFQQIERNGPLAASDFDDAKGNGGWWGWSDTKRALEWLFWAGHITTHSRRPSFERLYDLPERILPAEVINIPTPAPQDAHRELLCIAARAHGVATERDLRDYFRLSPGQSKPRIAELVEDGTLAPVEIKGWQQPAYLHKDARLPRAIRARALLAPFDPVVWERSRAERIFGFRYRIEIYTPAEKRVHGYYVLPFLLGDRLVARIDVKADRAIGTLKVQAAHMEPHAPAHTAEALNDELEVMADWLGMEHIHIRQRGDLAPALAAIRSEKFRQAGE